MVPGIALTAGTTERGEPCTRTTRSGSSTHNLGNDPRVWGKYCLENLENVRKLTLDASGAVAGTSSAMAVTHATTVLR